MCVMQLFIHYRISAVQSLKFGDRNNFIPLPVLIIRAWVKLIHVIKKNQKNLWLSFIIMPSGGSDLALHGEFCRITLQITGGAAYIETYVQW